MKRWIPLIIIGDLILFGGVYVWWKNGNEAATKQKAAAIVAADLKRRDPAKRIADKLASAAMTYIIKNHTFPSAEWRKELEPSLPAAPFKLALPPAGDGAVTDFKISNLLAGKKEAEVSSPPGSTVLFFEAPTGGGDVGAPPTPLRGVVIYADGTLGYETLKQAIQELNTGIISAKKPFINT